MVYKPHLKVVFRGIFDQTPEIWSHSHKFSRDISGSPDPGPDKIDLAACQTAWSAMASGAALATNVKLTDIRAYHIGSDGRMVGNPNILEMTGPPFPGGAGVVKYPPQVSLCVTTMAANRGHARFGRFYLPGPTKALGADSRMSVADRDGVITAVTAFVKAVSDAIDVEAVGASAAGINVSNDATGTWQQYDIVRVGRVFDTIRSRRGALDEDYGQSGDIDW